MMNNLFNFFCSIYIWINLLFIVNGIKVLFMYSYGFRFIDLEMVKNLDYKYNLEV